MSINYLGLQDSHLYVVQARNQELSWAKAVTKGSIMTNLIAIMNVLDIIAATIIDGTSIPAMHESMEKIDEISRQITALLPSWDCWMCDVRAEKSTFEYDLLRSMQRWCSQQYDVLNACYEYQMYIKEERDLEMEKEIEAELDLQWEDKYGHLEGSRHW